MRTAFIDLRYVWPQKKGTQSRNHLRTELEIQDIQESRIFSLNMWSLKIANEEKRTQASLNCILLPSYSNQQEKSGAYREVSKVGLSSVIRFMYNNQFSIL